MSAGTKRTDQDRGQANFGLRLIDAIYKKQFPKMVIAVAKYTGLRDLATAEDIVQEAFAEAAGKWNSEPPYNPEAWLYRVCRNIALNKLRQSKKLEYFVDETRFETEIDFESSSDGGQLQMLLACTHSTFSAKNQVIFALRYVAGFRIEQIANILGSPDDTITKTLFRMRETIVKENISFTFDISHATPSQAEILHKIVYLMFSEGSKTSGGRSILNLELCEDALSLALSISHSPALARDETHALLALMLFNLSRFEARFDERGEPVELEHQDRSKWNKAMFNVAVHHFTLAGNETTTYHLEAAIAWLHTSAPTFAETDWKSIALLYDKLIATNDSPFVRMNQSIALFYSGETLTALHQLKKLGENAFMQQHYLFHMALGKIYRSMGDETAKAHFKKAFELSPHEVEKRHIQRLFIA
jgi:RNA polymerase sigma factor (sigma-70 family)